MVNELLCHLRLVTPDTSAGPAYPPEAGALCVWAPVGVRIRSGPGMTACGTCHTGKEVLRIASHSSARSVRCPHVSIPATFGRGDGQISWLVLGAPPRRSHGLSRGVPGTGGMWTGTVGTGSEAVGQGAVTVGMGAVTVGVGSSGRGRGACGHRGWSQSPSGEGQSPSGRELRRWGKALGWSAPGPGRWGKRLGSSTW